MGRSMTRLVRMPFSPGQMCIRDSLKVHPHDFHSRRGMQMMIGKRRRLLDYLAKKDIERYRALIAKLGLRK